MPTNLTVYSSLFKKSGIMCSFVDFQNKNLGSNPKCN